MIVVKKRKAARDIYALRARLAITAFRAGYLRAGSEDRFNVFNGLQIPPG
jgi:hypothetical protein